MSKNEKTEPDIFLAQAGNITTRSPLCSAVGSERCLTFLHNNPEETLRGKLITFASLAKRGLVSTLDFFPL